MPRRVLAASSLVASLVACSRVARRPGPEAPTRSSRPPSKVVAVTVYQNTALVTREVTVPEAAGLDRGGRLPAAAGHHAKLALRRGRRRHPRPEHPLPHPGHRRGHPRGGPQARGADQDARPASSQTLQADLKAVEREPEAPRQARRVHRASARAPHREGPARQREDHRPGQVRHGRPRQAVEGAGRAQAADRGDAGADRRSRSGSSARRPAGRSGPSATRSSSSTRQAGGRHGAAELPGRARLVAAAVQAPRRRQGQGPGAGRVPGRRRRSRPARTGRTCTLTLSTAQPMLNAAPPDLRALEVAVGRRPRLAVGRGGRARRPGAAGRRPGPASAAAAGGMPNAVGVRPATWTSRRKDLRRQAAEQLQPEEGRGRRQAARTTPPPSSSSATCSSPRGRLAQGRPAAPRAGSARGRASPTTCRTKLTLPSRNDEQVLEIARSTWRRSSTTRPCRC